MSFDKSMLSLFSREALDACEKMRIAARSGDGELAVGAARALRSAAKMLGFDSCAALAEKLEKSLSENFEKSSSSPSTIKALEVISECAKVPPENIPSAFESRKKDIDGLLNSDFTANPSASGKNPPIEPKTSAVKPASVSGVAS